MSALWPINWNCLHFLVRRSQFIHENWPEWWEQELWLSPQHHSSPQTTAKASVKQTEQSEVDLQTWLVYSLRSRDRGKQGRHEMRGFLHLPWHPHTSSNSHPHADIWAFGWRLEHRLKSAQSDPGVLLESKELWRSILINAGSQLLVKWMGPNSLGMSRTRALGLLKAPVAAWHFSVIVQCFFSEACYK